MKTNGQDSAKSRKLRNIIVTVVAAVVIVFVGIWAISSAMNSSVTKAPEDNNEAVASKEEPTQKGTTPTSPSAQYTSSSNSTSTPAAEAMPKTGPAEVAFGAIMLGVVAYLVALNVNLVKSER